MRLVSRQLAGHVPHVTFRGTTSSTAHRTIHVIMSFCDQIAVLSILKPVVGHVPETGTSIQRTTLNKPRRSTATRTSSRNPQGPPRTGSADTPTSNGTRVKTKKSTAVRSSQKSATVPKQIDVQVNLSNRDKGNMNDINNEQRNH